MRILKTLAIFIAVLMTIGVVALMTVNAETGAVDTPVDTQPVVTNPAPVTDPPAPTNAPAPTNPPATVVTPDNNESDYNNNNNNGGYVAPTEYNEYQAPNTYSQYDNTVSLYDTEKINNEESDYEQLDEAEILALSNDSADGIKDFSDIKNNTSRGDETSPALLILGLLFVFAAIAGFTFAVVYNPEKKKPAVAGAARVENSRGDSQRSHSSQHAHSSQRSHSSRISSASNHSGYSRSSRSSSSGSRYRSSDSRTRETRSRNDYNDGY